MRSPCKIWVNKVMSINTMMFSEEGWFRPRNTFIPLKEIEKKSIGNTANECTKWNNWKHCFLFFITNIRLATFIFRLFHVFRTFLQWANCETKKNKPFMTEISLANKEFLSYSRNYEIWNWCTTDALMLCQFWNLGRSQLN